MKKTYCKPAVEEVTICSEGLMAGSPGLPNGGEVRIGDAEAKATYYDSYDEDETGDAWGDTWGE